MLMVAGAEKKFLVPHPDRPKARRPPDPARIKKLIDARNRARERRRKIEAGEIT